MMVAMMEGPTRQSPSHVLVQQILLRDADVHIDPPLQVGAVNHHAIYHPLMPHVQRTRNAVYVVVATSTPLISSLSAPQERCLTYAVAF
jgi:hypothetical protein